MLLFCVADSGVVRWNWIFALEGWETSKISLNTFRKESMVISTPRGEYDLYFSYANRLRLSASLCHAHRSESVYFSGRKKKKKKARVIVSGSPSFDLASRIFCLALCLAADGNWEA